MPSYGAARGVTCRFVWLGGELPYTARLAIESALVAMPDATVEVHMVGVGQRGVHAEAVARYERVWVRDMTLASCFRDLPERPRRYLDLIANLPGRAPAAVGNLVRLALLHRFGGIYLDTDVLVIRGLHDPWTHGAYVGTESVWAANRARVTTGLGVAGTVRALPWAATWAVRRADSKFAAGRWRTADRLADRGMRMQVNNAVIGAPAGSTFIREALATALTTDPHPRFALGPLLLDEVARRFPCSVTIVPPSRFYSIPPGQSFRCFDDAVVELPRDAQLIHWVASNHPRIVTISPDDARFATGTAPFWRLARATRAAAPALPHKATELARKVVAR